MFTFIHLHICNLSNIGTIMQTNTLRCKRIETDTLDCCNNIYREIHIRILIVIEEYLQLYLNSPDIVL